MIIIGDWFDETILQSEKYPDENTRSDWYPITGGANVPSINRLLGHYNASIGMQSFKGVFQVNGSEVCDLFVLFSYLFLLLFTLIFSFF